MNKIEINECVYHIHPLYVLYAADINGILSILSKKYLTKVIKITLDI